MVRRLSQVLSGLAAILGFVGLFLPWFNIVALKKPALNVGDGNVTGFKVFTWIGKFYKGWEGMVLGFALFFVILIFAIVLISSIRKLLNAMSGGTGSLFLIISGGLILLFMVPVYTLLKIQTDFTVGEKYGLFISLVAAVLIIVVGVFARFGQRNHVILSSKLRASAKPQDEAIAE